MCFIIFSSYNGIYSNKKNLDFSRFFIFFVFGAGDQVWTGTPKGWSLSTLTLLCYPRKKCSMSIWMQSETVKFIFCFSCIITYILYIISYWKNNMDFWFAYEVFQRLSIEIMSALELYGVKWLKAIMILLIWVVISYWIYRATLYLFWKFWIVDLINRLWDWFEENTTKIVDKTPDDNEAAQELEKEKKAEKPKKVRYDKIVAKSFSYYVFLLFFRWAIVVIGITEVERFMQDLLAYLPNLFVWVVIWFFGVRFANSVHDIIYQTLELTKDKTSKIIAMWAKVIIMFFTLMIMLNYIQIVDEFIINALFLGFITTLTISLGLSFGLGWKEIAREILESFRK